MTLGNRNEALFEANKSRPLASSKKLFILNLFGINVSSILFSSNAFNKKIIREFKKTHFSFFHSIAWNIKQL